MSKDIVQRLLENVPCFDAEGNRRKKPCGYDGGMCPECRKKQDAADLIEALEAEVGRVKAMTDYVLTLKDAAEAQASRMRDALGKISAFQSEIPGWYVKVAQNALEEQ